MREWVSRRAREISDPLPPAGVAWVSDPSLVPGETGLDPDVGLRVPTQTHTLAHTHPHTPTCAHAHTHTHTPYAYACAYICTYTHVPICVSMCIPMPLPVHKHMHIPVHMPGHIHYAVHEYLGARRVQKSQRMHQQGGRESRCLGDE